MKVAIPPSSRIPEISTSIGLSDRPYLDDSDLYRLAPLIDANFDRDREGLRVLEE